MNWLNLLLQSDVGIKKEDSIVHITLDEYNISLDIEVKNRVCTEVTVYHDTGGEDKFSTTNITDSLEMFIGECDRVGTWLPCGGNPYDVVDNVDRRNSCEYLGIEFDRFCILKQDIERQEKRVKKPNTGIKVTPRNPDSYYPWMGDWEYPVLLDYSETMEDNEPFNIEWTDEDYIVVSLKDKWMACKRYLINKIDLEDNLEHGVSSSTINFGNQLYGCKIKYVREDKVYTATVTDFNIKPRDVRKMGWDMRPISTAPGNCSLMKVRNIDTDDETLVRPVEIVAVLKSDFENKKDKLFNTVAGHIEKSYEDAFPKSDYAIIHQPKP